MAATVTPSWFRKQIALPSEHGSWVLLLGPLTIGLAAAPGISTPSLYVAIAALTGFLARQPITLVVKALSGRRSRQDLPAAWFWVGVYGSLSALMVVGLVMRGHAYVLLLALPGIPVLAWQLVLVARRAERRQELLEIVGAGVLALAAPAAYWVGAGSADAAGWWLWLLTWAQSTTAIVYTYLRLEQRTLAAVPHIGARLRMGTPALTCSTLALVTVSALCAVRVLPPWLFVSYAVQWLETLNGVRRPAIGFKPIRIGWRQLTVSVVFTLLFIIGWRG